jgi:hypothetical protein
MPITSVVLAFLVIALLLVYLGYIAWAVVIAQRSSRGDSLDTQHKNPGDATPEDEVVEEKVSGSH